MKVLPGSPLSRGRRMDLSNDKNFCKRNDVTWPSSFHQSDCLNGPHSYPKKFLVILFFISCALRILFFVSFNRHGHNAWIYVDSDQYVSIAKSIVQGDGISDSSGRVQYYRLPGYPLFLAPFYAMGDDNMTYALLFQIILASLIPLLLFLLMWRLFQSITLAKIAGIAAAIHPGLIIYASMIATESLCTLFLLIFFLFFFCIVGRVRDQNSSGRAREGTARPILSLFLAGICLGVVSLLRPVGHYTLLLSTAILFFTSATISKKLLQTLALSSGWLIVTVWWLVRNFMLTGALFFHSLPGLHFLQYMAAPIVAERDASSYVQARQQVLTEWNDLVSQQEQVSGAVFNDYQCSCVGQKLAMQYVLQHPLYAAKRACIEMFKTIAGLYSAILLLADGATWPAYDASCTWTAKIKRFLNPVVQRWWLVPFIYYEILFLFLMLIGCFLAFAAAWIYSQLRSFVFIFSLFIVLFVGLTLAYGGARLRMPIEPLIIAMASVGWLTWFGRMRLKNFS